MKETKFTKGPWECVTHDGGVKHAVIYVEGGGFDISNCPDSVANAHLIAAAPEMYEMLEMLLEALRIEGKYSCTQLDIEMLLAKARGE